MASPNQRNTWGAPWHERLDVSGPLSDAQVLALLDRLDHEPADALESQWLDFKPW